MMQLSLQETFAPHGRCFGCGPQNERGLRIASFVSEDGNSVVCTWSPEPHHEAFGNVVNGGILGAILDCHMNWTAIHHLMKTNGLTAAPCCVTAVFKVELKRPTPRAPLHLSAHILTSATDRANVEATVTSDGRITAVGTGTFVAVKPDHPAYHRW
jgi:acyl-coenzyme A thioesterase PaaI-like protein